MSNNIGYHTRLYSDNTVKVVGGSFGGAIDQDTVERLTSLFTVTVKPSGTAVFVDREGREVRLYISVDAGKTVKGKEALLKYRQEWEAIDRANKKMEQEKQQQIEDLMDGLSHEEIIQRLPRS